MEENNHSISCGAIKACDQFQLKYPGIVRIVIKAVHQLFLSCQNKTCCDNRYCSLRLMTSFS
jgi:hypothetical protein